MHLGAIKRSQVVVVQDLMFRVVGLDTCSRQMHPTVASKLLWGCH